ncbi:olfactory receptor 52K1-like [Spea bombifrons]|uniref:olfactory receptor 52K1-like n=1 Tax=Spea bombifrons TaxID=233779 RepID=UPI00234B1689|nr:olfactory receptor 52K1-like [Spea bombifrons]
MNPNQTLFFSHTEFLLLGFPGISKARPLVVIPFLSIYVVILTGNSLVIHQIRIEKSLQSPMYYLISLLFAVNITSTSVVLPKFLLGLAFNLNEVTLHGCLAQMFCIYFLAIFESSVVLLMALDRYVAICRPLHYHHIMTKPFLLRLGLIGLLRGGVLVSPLVILASRVRFCGSNVILNFACENMALLSLACGDVSKSQVAGMAVRVLVTVIDVAFLLVSYSGILYTAMNIAAGKARHKALHTCSTHLSVAVSIYLSALLASVVYRMETVSYDVQNLFSAVYLMVPATLNPFIYGLRVKEIRECLARSWRKRNASPAHKRVNRT